MGSIMSLVIIGQGFCTTNVKNTNENRTKSPLWPFEIFVLRVESVYEYGPIIYHPFFTLKPFCHPSRHCLLYLPLTSLSLFLHPHYIIILNFLQPHSLHYFVLFTSKLTLPLPQAPILAIAACHTYALTQHLKKHSVQCIFIYTLLYAPPSASKRLPFFSPRPPLTHIHPRNYFILER